MESFNFPCKQDGNLINNMASAGTIPTKNWITFGSITPQEIDKNR